MARDSEPISGSDPARFLNSAEALLASLYAQSAASRWGLSLPSFAATLERSLCKRFANGGTAADFTEYLEGLYLEDLALACACEEDLEPAWNYFVQNHRNRLRAAAAVICRHSRSGVDAYELADSLFADLYGLADGQRGQQSLFRYFHGRSSLMTWLRAILAQRHVDLIRESRRREAIDGPDGNENRAFLRQAGMTVPADPHREEYRARFATALEASLASLPPKDRSRLELYYAREQTLAATGRALGEHESSVSRNLERVRRDLRLRVEDELRSPPPLSDAEIALCFQYAAEDAVIDFRRLFPTAEPQALRPGKKGPP